MDGWSEWWRLHLLGPAQRHVNASRPSDILLSILPALMDYLSRRGGEVQGDQLVEATDSDRVIPQSKQAEAAGEGLSALHPLAKLINQKLRKGVCYFPSHITDTMCLGPRMQENTNRWPFSSELMLHANNQEGKQGQRNKLAACYPKGKQVIPMIGVFHTDNETLIIAAVQWVKSSWAHSDKGRLHTNH